MAFNFNWSPIIADTSRARDMLTTALNKSPKPPIIVDDIIVTELNLGTKPPELEILEIGDLAEDRFRGIFKMSYTGDAFLTLKTRVQANPLNTYLSTKPSFASPQPLAAASSLTIPLQITLSDIRLSGFVILVFSKQKGLTLVFRNDPLESLKVSSTFDSIPFVRDYLQKEIEGQLRVLFMEDLPAIIHRLSLRLWSSEYEEMEETEERLDSKDTTAPIDPLATSPQDAIDAFGNPIDETQISTPSVDSATEIHASFSRKNILRLAALSESQRTLSLFTPGIPEAVFRAWAGHSDPNTSGAATPALTLSSLSRIQSTFGGMKSNASSVLSGSTGNDTQSSRPTLVSTPSTPGGLALGANRGRSHPQRKRKKRVVDLRKNRDGAESSGVSTETSTPAPSTDVSESASIASIPEEPEEEEEISTPTPSPRQLVERIERMQSDLYLDEPLSETATPDGLLPAAPLKERTTPSRPPLTPSRTRPVQQKASPLFRTLSFDKVPTLSSDSKSPVASTPQTESSGGILEQAWMLKMAQEIARKVHDEKEREAGRDRGSPRPSVRRSKTEGMWVRDDEMEAPPAYQA